MPTDQASPTMVHRRPLAAHETTCDAPLAERWLDAWNAHDLDRIMALYAPDARHTSSRVRALGGQEATVRGAAITEYFRAGLARYPSLRFKPISVSAGPRTVAIEYRATGVDRDEQTIELLELDEHGLIVHSRVYHDA